MSVVIRKADPPDARPLAAVLARAFLDDPLMRFILPDEGARRRRLPRLFRISLGLQYLPTGEVYTTSDRAGASLWSPPGRWRAPPSIVIPPPSMTYKPGLKVTVFPALIWIPPQNV